jgi:hypothetical protein
MKKDITELFMFVDDFFKCADKLIQSQCLSHQKIRSPTRTPELSMSEIMTIILLFQHSPCKNFKYFYKGYLPLYAEEFPRLCSYNRFIELQPRALPYLTLLLYWICEQAEKTGISFIDATSLAVCHNKRIYSHKVFKDIAKLGKTTKGWFLGLKLHIVINEKGEIQGAKLTPGNVDDRTPVPELTKKLVGLLFGDKGYVKQELFEELYKRDLKLITGLKKNMKNKLMTWQEKILLRKRSIIETVFDYLKNKFQLEHTRHRSPWNAFVHILSTLIAYSLKSHKPKIKFDFLIPN